MSLFDYKQSQIIASKGYTFYALLMTVMRQADTDNTEKLRSLFPEVWEELRARYNATNGILEYDAHTAGY